MLEEIQDKIRTEILRYVKETKADLLVMGTVGKTGLDRILIGSVSLKVVREVPVSMILIREQSPIRLNIDEEIRDLSSCLKKGRELLENGFPKLFQLRITVDPVHSVTPLIQSDNLTIFFQPDRVLPRRNNHLPP